MIWVALAAAKLNDKPRSLVNRLSLVHKQTRTGLYLRFTPQEPLLTASDVCSQTYFDCEDEKHGDRDSAAGCARSAFVNT